MLAISSIHSPENRPDRAIILCRVTTSLGKRWQNSVITVFKGRVQFCLEFVEIASLAKYYPAEKNNSFAKWNHSCMPPLGRVWNNYMYCTDQVLTDMSTMRWDGIHSSPEVQVDWQPEQVITKMIGDWEFVQRWHPKRILLTSQLLSQSSLSDELIFLLCICWPL